MDKNSTALKDTKCFDFMEEPDENALEVSRNELTHHSWEISLDSFLENIENASERALSLTIKDQRSLEMVLDLSVEIMNIKDRIEAYRKGAGKPHRKIIQKINDHAKKTIDVLDRVKAGLTYKLSEWQLTQEMISIKAKEEASGIAESLGLNVDIIAPDAPKTMNSDKAGTSFRETCTFEITDAELVPDEYWVIDDKLIQKHIDLGKRDIPGVKLIVEKNLIIRRKA